jgi:hypothetical protein
MNNNVLRIAVAALTFAAAGCGRQEPAVAELRVEPARLRLGPAELQRLRFTWSPSAPLAGGGQPTVFVHLLDRREKVVRTFDHLFPQRWSEGEPVAYDVAVFQSALAPPLVPGKYRLSVGLYGPGGERWALDGLGKPLRRDEYVAAAVEVPADGGGPRFVFPPEWGPLEPGSDRQVLARRWLAGEASFRLEGVRGRGAVWLVLRIPSADGPGQSLQLDGGSGAPSVRIRVSDSCGGVETAVSGPGRHEIEMPVDEVPQDGICTIALRPNFRFVAPGLAGPRSASLETAAWISAANRRAPPAAERPQG